MNTVVGTETWFIGIIDLYQNYAEGFLPTNLAQSQLSPQNVQILANSVFKEISLKVFGAL